MNGSNYNGHDLSDIINAQYNGSRRGMSLWEYAETYEDYDNDCEEKLDCAPLENRGSCFM